MKLQRNNKYTKRLTAGLASAILSASILVGCTNTQALTPTPTPTPIEIVEVEEKPIIKDVNYFFNYYKISDEEVEKRLEDYDIKHKDAKWCMINIGTIFLEDKDKNLKVLQVIERYETIDGIDMLCLYDLFTEEHLFDIPDFYKDLTDNVVFNDKYEYENIDFSKAINKASYFSDKTIKAYGVCMSSALLGKNYINYFREKDRINYIDVGFQPAYCMYPTGIFDTDKVFFTTEEIAECYVKTVPEECRVTSKELGLSSTYHEERRFADCWKIGEEEIEKRLAEMDLYMEDSIFPYTQLATLTIKDSDGNYKIFNVIIQQTDDILKVYDIISGVYLFSIGNAHRYDNNNDFKNIKFDQVVETIPYFADKEFIEFDTIYKTNTFLKDNIEDIRKQYGDNYAYPNDSYVAYKLFPYSEFNFAECEASIRDIAINYVVCVPQEMQVTAKELNIGLDSEIENTNEKVLVK